MKTMNLLPRKMHINITFCLHQVKNFCCKLRNSLFPVWVENKPTDSKHDFWLGQSSFSRSSLRFCMVLLLFFFFLPGSSELEIIWIRFFFKSTWIKFGFQEMGLVEKKSPLGNSLPEAGKWRYSALVFVIFLSQFFPLSTLEDRQCAYLHAHTGSQYRPLRRFHTTYKKITRQSKLPSLLHTNLAAVFPWPLSPLMAVLASSPLIFLWIKGKKKGLWPLPPVCASSVMFKGKDRSSGKVPVVTHLQSRLQSHYSHCHHCTTSLKKLLGLYYRYKDKSWL